ncbi:MAG: hypothetical protein A3F70_19380 [Acidobacteria bacterium RIFCSPLOWO2_12_FULL_67_14]|nr:MAG: hypothetical protein A3H29_03745 [Acidobacteria bacterium RIFCSPLOWO2_02_FULL_67_21]OFW40297.1 MAG: hypothetical protein A3F70_19380 [Acidobacteria bacterium RIFCSPLOWO2_12_FULL_67_14]
MTWKSYVTVSGATVVAGWLASSAPPQPAPVARPRALQTPAPNVAASDIQEQAERLRAPLPAERTYTTPHRNPFRFADRISIEQPGTAAAARTEAPPADVRPAGPRVSLSGIAEDATPGGPERTAILSGPGGVLIVREGEEILGFYRVVRIDSEAVELQALRDGSVQRLTLR